ncbi:MAG: hypothetical protein HOP19_00445 [Acidobacteria bacterium]|nr:hypothetical protein [Acidobacteriota bacterium]
MSFTANQGQAEAGVRFTAQGMGYQMEVTGTEARLALQSPAKEPAVITMKLLGAHAQPRVTGSDELPGKSNFLIGDDPREWRTDVAQYARVTAHAVYPGIDLVYYGKQQELEYDFVVAPGADAEAIRLGFNGASQPTLDAQGALVLHTAAGEVRQHAPMVYQETVNGRTIIAGRYRLHEAKAVSFELGKYDRSLPLVIDPVLSYAAFVKGVPFAAQTIAADAAGNAYLLGTVSEEDVPVNAPLRGSAAHVVVTKLSPAGVPLYTTYLGGRNGALGNSLAVDAEGNVYLTGFTSARDFPRANALQSVVRGGNDLFITKLNATGNGLIFSTLLGGGNEDYANAIAVDGARNVYVAGTTYSNDFPTTPNSLRPAGVLSGGNTDAFVMKLEATGRTLAYGTYLGGALTDEANAIAVDAGGNAFITGVTGSPDFPTRDAVQARLGADSDDGER